MKKGISITGQEILVFKNIHSYSTTISNKDINGNWERMYITLQLPKDIQVGNRAKININNGFMSFYKDKNGLPKPKIVVTDLEILDFGDEIAENIPNDDDLPF